MNLTFSSNNSHQVILQIILDQMFYPFKFKNSNIYINKLVDWDNNDHKSKYIKYYNRQASLPNDILVLKFSSRNTK